jgi:hypothetical protein
MSLDTAPGKETTIFILNCNGSVFDLDDLFYPLRGGGLP